MSVITDAIYNKMIQDVKLSGTFTNGVPNGGGLLSVYGTYKFDPATGQYINNKKVAIFTYEPIDDDPAITSYVITTGHVSDVSASRASSKTRKARDIQRDIRCFFKQDNDPSTKDNTYAEVEAIAERVYEIFHRKPLTIPDPSDPTNYTKWQTVMVTCNGPILIPAEQQKLFDKGIDMMVVTLNFTIQEFR